MPSLKCIVVIVVWCALTLSRALAADAGETYGTPPTDQIAKLFDAVTVGELENVKILALRRVVTGASDAQLRREAKDQVDVLAKAKVIAVGPSKAERDAAETEAYERLAKLRHGAIVYKTQEWKSGGLYRLDQATGESIEKLLQSKNFDFTDVFTGDRVKNNFTSHSYNYGAKAASIDSRKEVLVQPVGLWNAGRAPIGLSLLFKMHLALAGSGLKPKLDTGKLGSVASAAHPVFRLLWRPTTLGEHKVHEFIFCEPGKLATPIFRLYCDEGNYKRIYRSELLHENRLLQVNEAEGFDKADFPRRWIKSEYSGAATDAEPTKVSTIDFLEVNLAPDIKTSDFAFAPPEEFSITDYSSGSGVVVRFPKVGGKRLTTKSLTPPVGVAADKGRKRFSERLVMSCIIGGNVVVMLFVAGRWVRKRQTMGLSCNPAHRE